MVGKIFITRTGYDPQLGKHVKDPYLGPKPTLGACRPDLRRQLSEGDHIFVISGKVPGAEQFVMGGFEIEARMTALEAYRRFPQHRLRRRADGQLTGNVIVNAHGEQHELDDHESFSSRIKNYLSGKNPIVLQTSPEIARGRAETLEALQEILQKKGNSPIRVVGRWGSDLTEVQVLHLRDWLARIKRDTVN
jgi:hypothetical protein